MNSKRIEHGDIVRVFFNNTVTVEGAVDYIPQSTGDSWIILESQANLPVYVQSFNYIILVHKGE